MHNNGRLRSAQASLRRVEELHHENMLSPATWQQIEPQIRKQIADALASQTALLEEHPDLQFEERIDAEREES